MTFDLLPSRLLSVPTFPLSTLWDEDDFLGSRSASGLSVSEDEKNIFVEAALPGIDPKDVEMTFHDGYLWIRGEVKSEENDTDRKYYRQASRSFSYRIALPGEVDTAIDPTAVSKNGIMTVTFTKSPKAQPKKIQISVDKETEEKK
jgi:HSP20 family protein